MTVLSLEPASSRPRTQSVGPASRGSKAATEPAVDWSVFLSTEATARPFRPRDPASRTSPEPLPFSARQPYRPSTYGSTAAPSQRTMPLPTPSTYSPITLEAQSPTIDWRSLEAPDTATSGSTPRFSRLSEPAGGGPSVRTRSSPPTRSPSYSDASPRSPYFHWSAIQPYDATSPTFGLARPNDRPMTPTPKAEIPSGRPLPQRPCHAAPHPPLPRLDWAGALTIAAPVLHTGGTPTRAASFSPISEVSAPRGTSATSPRLSDYRSGAASPRSAASGRSTPRFTPPLPVAPDAPGEDWSLFLAQESRAPSFARITKSPATCTYSHVDFKVDTSYIDV